jgi:hypothetical protein
VWPGGAGHPSEVFRRFDFEAETYTSLSCVPLAVRRKLDLAGLKISLRGWQALPRAERLALCHLPVDGPGDLDMYREVLRAYAERAGAELTELPEITPAAWAIGAVPERVAERASALGRDLPTTRWAMLDEETRYCLWKYATTKHDPAKVATLFAEALDPLTHR